METYAKRILCVDDDLDTLKLRKTLLEASGYFVLTASSGADALRMLVDRNDVDLVLLDYVMPGMSGDELAETLRQRYPAVPLVVISAVGRLPEKLLSTVDSHAQKGQDPEILLSILHAVLSRSAGTPPAIQAATAKTVLCVDDELLQLQLRKMLFESAGLQVLLAQTPTAAMHFFRSQPVDAVVMDYWLSGANGTTLAEEMKRLRPRIPIVMLSGFSSLPGEGVIVDAWLRKADVEAEALVDEVKRLITLRSRAPQGAE